MSQGVIYARAKPRWIKVNEVYAHQTRISAGSNTQLRTQPTGTIEIMVAYDGHQSFGRLAIEDVKRQLKADAKNGATAVIGHLAFAGYERTDLDAVLEMNTRPSSTVPVEVLISSGEYGLTRIEDLGADRKVCILSQVYHPEWPESVPLHVDMRILDEQMAQEMVDGEGIGTWEVVEQEASFQESLLLLFRVQLSLPDRLFGPPKKESAREKQTAPEVTEEVATPTPAQAAPQSAASATPSSANQAVETTPEQPPASQPAVPETTEVPPQPATAPVAAGVSRQPSAQPQPAIPVSTQLPVTGKKEQKITVRPRLRRMSLQWPTAVSHRSVRLLVGDSQDDHPLVYEPEGGVISWGGLELTYAGKAEGTDLHWFSSPLMTLLIEHPGELYRVPRLTGNIEVEVPDLLLSGLQLRSFDAQGNLMTAVPVEVNTTISSEIVVIPEECFQRRVFSLYQRLDFTGVVVDEMRLADIRTILQDHWFRGIRVQQLMRDDKRAAYLISGVRVEGASSLALRVYVTGTFATSERRTIIAGGREFHTPVRTGDMVVHLRGKLEGYNERLSGVLNQIHCALKARFSHVVVD